MPSWGRRVVRGRGQVGVRASRRETQRSMWARGGGGVGGHNFERDREEEEEGEDVIFQGNIYVLVFGNKVFALFGSSR